ncbi:Lrp/AsnC family transcriptional regulator [Brachybacterium paraconglomeratum]|uniref:Lrp/AsnC family transcriptional regulator n=1 Tax=Brachybacterium paraconglomeratum TaxID=173362 RepID=A0A921GMD7_9MICO|nr:Lrp/AsnC family transcriptional regulator [Brachybacterium paraconglomeratum]MCT1435857.1 Lrp/AsnC family transcriptional regulator [Brachybacterium paraconglomeratum]HEV6952886.1 Lrp/AsnC family transcriptional regulator [Promicromonospora sp.]HJF49455.1 Lrp/AsnC family transcriptional regulator [Brachybacterium paraconglomeratum]
MHIVDDTDRRILLAMTENPRATIVSVAQKLGLSRNTVQARLAALEAGQALQGYDRRLHAASLGYPLTVFMETQVDQPKLEQVIAQLRDIPEVVQVHGLSGLNDILVRCVCRDAEDLYRVNKLVLGCDGVIRTDTSLAMGELIPFRLAPVLERDLGR